jgi:hypothetical protein
LDDEWYVAGDRARTIQSMGTASVIPFPTRRRRPPLHRAVAARRRLNGSGGRAWINGREVGGTDRRFAHLSRSHD